MGSETVIDNAAFNALMDLGGKEFVLQMIDTFLSYAPNLLREARRGLGAGDIEPVLRMGHSLHSGARTIGVPRMVEIGSHIERLARAKQITSLPALVDEMERAFIEAKTCLEEKKAGL
jgi:HPt (histidine-containing phosphotransfer) domain-containing protein